MSHLPILIPGRAEPVNVPYRYDNDCFHVDVFLPRRGIRRCVVWLTSRDITEIEVSAVGLADNEKVAGLRTVKNDGLSIDGDEQRRADEAAADVLEAVLSAVGLHTAKRTPFTSHETRSAIARAYLAEVEAYEAGIKAHNALPGRLRSVALIPDNPCGLDPAWLPPSRLMLARYVEWCFEEAQKAQAAKAERQEAEWARENVGDSAPSGSELGRF